MESTRSSAYLLISVVNLKKPKNISLKRYFPNILELNIILSYPVFLLASPTLGSERQARRVGSQ